MSYCEINDAFNNKTYNFRDRYKNSTSEDFDFNISNIPIGKMYSSNNKITAENEKKPMKNGHEKGQDSDWASVDSETILLPKRKKIILKDDEISLESLSMQKSTNEENNYSGTPLEKLLKKSDS